MVIVVRCRVRPADLRTGEQHFSSALAGESQESGATEISEGGRKQIGREARAPLKHLRGGVHHPLADNPAAMLAGVAAHTEDVEEEGIAAVCETNLTLRYRTQPVKERRCYRRSNGEKGRCSCGGQAERPLLQGKAGWCAPLRPSAMR